MPVDLGDAKDRVLAYFAAAGDAVYRPRELMRIVSEERGRWGLPPGLRPGKVVSFLREAGRLKVIQLESETYRNREVFAWGDPSPFRVALSLGKAPYLSHGTAVFLQGLTEQIPKTIYVNDEQSPKASTRSVPLSQERLAFAFTRKQRESQYVFTWDGTRAVLLGGKDTGRLGVIHLLEGPDGETLPVTGLERTLIDIVVRPAYAGGIFHVLDAYSAAKERASAEGIADMLRELAYVYPYHQAIGFLMERAGWEEAGIQGLRRLGLQYDFYLQHGMKDPEYDSRWRLFHPKGL